MTAFVNHCWAESGGLLLQAAGLHLPFNSPSVDDKERIITH